MATEPMHEAVIRLDKTINRLDSTINELSRTVSSLSETMKLHIDTLRIDLQKVERVVDSRATQSSVNEMGDDLRINLKAMNEKLDALLKHQQTPVAKSSSEYFEPKSEY